MELEGRQWSWRDQEGQAMELGEREGQAIELDAGSWRWRACILAMPAQGIPDSPYTLTLMQPCKSCLIALMLQSKTALS